MSLPRSKRARAMLRYAVKHQTSQTVSFLFDLENSKKNSKKIQKICKIRQFRVWRMSWSDVWCLNVSGRRRTVQADQAATASRTMISSGQTTPRPSHDWPKGFWVKIFDTVVNTLGERPMKIRIWLIFSRYSGLCGSKRIYHKNRTCSKFAQM